MRLAPVRAIGTAILLLLGFVWIPAKEAQAWESILYPSDWVPGLTDSEGRFLQDFSYAGYHRGELPIPVEIPGAFVDVTAWPYGADPTGFEDATAAIQMAIDDVGGQGGGIVYLPEGTYRLQIKSGDDHALWIHNSGVVLRGAGKNRTFLFLDETYTRRTQTIKIRPDSGAYWHSALKGTTREITVDLLEPTMEIPVADVSPFAVGDWIVVRSDATDAFIDEHDMEGRWDSSLAGPTFYRRIVAVNAVANTITIDIPTRYPLKTRDNARVYKTVGRHIEEIGLEDFSIGMRENRKDGWGSADYEDEGTGAYEVHRSYAVYFKQVANAWVQRVGSYRPQTNTKNVHIHSNGLNIFESRSITVRNTNFSNPQSLAGGGNGYCYTAAGGDSLFEQNVAANCRHAYSLKKMWASGNVFLRNLSKNSLRPSGFTMYLSMANLFDNHILNEDAIEARYRHAGFPEHGHSTTQSVIWNTQGLRYSSGGDYAVWSTQFEHGYVIGTRGPAANVKSTPTKEYQDWVETVPEDWVEGVGQGDSLEPQSLYEDQLAKRIENDGESELPSDGTSEGDSEAGQSEPTDTTAPEVKITLVLRNLRPLSIIVDATDDTAVSHGEIYIDGELKVTLLGNSPYGYNWDLHDRASHNVLVKAYDRAGNVGTSEIEVEQK